MIIVKATLYRYSLPLRRPLTLAGRECNRRDGLIVRLESEKGNVAYGEASPLDGFCSESLKDAERQLKSVVHRFDGLSIAQDEAKLDGSLGDWIDKHTVLLDGSLCASARYALETAILQLLSADRSVALGQLIDPACHATVDLNCLLVGDEEALLTRAARLVRAGFRTFKLKVGRRTPKDDADLIVQLREVVGNDATIRLDANRSYSVADAIGLSHMVIGAGIAYIEEPVASYAELSDLAIDKQFLLPLALDESLMDMSPEELTVLPKVTTIVLKPSLIGLEKSVAFIRRARELRMTPVISSAFSSSIGLIPQIHLAAALADIRVAAGFDTLNWFDDDLLRPPVNTVKPALCLADLPDTGSCIRMEMLHEVVE